jgi:hypothetical protein
MQIDGIKITEDKVSLDSAKKFIEGVRKLTPGKRIAEIKVTLDGEFGDLTVTFAAVPFKRIRRITGYLVGDTSRWNDGKYAELQDRQKHTN